MRSRGPEWLLGLRSPKKCKILGKNHSQSFLSNCYLSIFSAIFALKHENSNEQENEQNSSLFFPKMSLIFAGVKITE